MKALLKWGIPAAAGAAAAFLYWQDNSLTVSEYEVMLARLPKAFDGLKMVQLSDLHNKRFGSGQRTIEGFIRRQQPDVIVITGDLVDKHRDVHGDLSDALRLAQKAVELAPVYYVAGNHEWQGGIYPSLSRKLQEIGVQLLDDSVQPLRRGGEEILLVGLRDPAAWACPAAFSTSVARKKRCWQIAKTELDRLCRNSPDVCKILLAHRPEMFELYANADVDLVFSGHAHGGQIRLPVCGGLYAPGQGVLPRFTAGLHQSGHTLMAVSRGLGNSGFPFRVFNRPELVAVTLRAGGCVPSLD